MSYGVDYTQHHPPFDALKAHQVIFVGRNLLGDGHLTRQEATMLTSYGIWIVSVHKVSVESLEEGAVAGEREAREALLNAYNCSQPEDRPIYFDFTSAQSTGPNSVDDYLRGVRRALGLHKVGVVSKYLVEEDHSYRWQVAGPHAWHKDNHLERYWENVKIGGIDSNEDRSRAADYGQWQVDTDPFPLGKESN